MPQEDDNCTVITLPRADDLKKIARQCKKFKYTIMYFSIDSKKNRLIITETPYEMPTFKYSLKISYFKKYNLKSSHCYNSTMLLCAINLLERDK